MGLGLNKFFGKKDGNPKTDRVTVTGITKDGSIIVASTVNWQQKGVEEAGASKGDLNAFSAGFNSAYAGIKKSQELDQDLQKKMQDNLQTEITNLEANKENDRNKLDLEEENLKSVNSDIKDKEEEIKKVKEDGIKKNRTVVANFIIGGIILVSMTLFLLLFYSSTMYSAFFKDFGEGDTAYTAMFDGAAVSKSFSEGIFEGLFILFFPMTFMGLGFVIHQFSVNKKGFERYFKSFVLYALTFAFDFLLAYKISKAIYDVELPYNPGLPPFSLKVALADMDFWIVIFCGFVTYVIWGLVFSFVMENYDKMTNNKFVLENLKAELRKLQSKQGSIQQTITTLKNNLNNLEAKIKQKKSQFTFVRYDFAAMKKYLAEYYQGWISYINLYRGDSSAIADRYEKEMKGVENWMNGIENKK